MRKSYSEIRSPFLQQEKLKHLRVTVKQYTAHYDLGTKACHALALSVVLSWFYQSNYLSQNPMGLICASD